MSNEFAPSPASPVLPTLFTAYLKNGRRLNTRSRLPTIRRRARPSSTIAARMRFRSMRSSGLLSNGSYTMGRHD